MTNSNPVNPPADRRVATEQLRQRLLTAREDGLPPGEMSKLESDATAFIKRELRLMKTEFGNAVPQWYDPEMLVRDACTAVSTTRGLWEAEASTVLGAVMSAGQLGLRIAVLGQCWILPFWNGRRGRVEAQLIIGYQGYEELAYGSGRVAEISSEIVYQREVDDGRFDFDYIEERPRLWHKPDFSITSQRSCPLCNETDPQCVNVNQHGEKINVFYARGRTTDGGFSLPRPWGLAMMREHRDRYAKRTRKGVIEGPWIEHFPAMGKKTMIRELVRHLPKNRELAHAFQADEGVRDTFSPNVQPGEATDHDHGGHVILDGQTVSGQTPEDMAAQTQHPADR